MSDKSSDQWRTPAWLFDQLNREHGPFDIDLCATKENTKCDIWYSDYLTNQMSQKNGQYTSAEVWPVNFEFDPKICFMNPPYSNPKPFIEKAWEDSKHCKIVCLVKCDPSTRWWATFWNYETKICDDCQGTKCHILPTSGASRSCYTCLRTGYIKQNGPKPGCDYKFLPKRVKFDPPQGWEGKTSGPAFPSAIIIMDRRGVK